MELELTLDSRATLGKANKRLRRGGIVPGVVYGKDQESTPVQVDAKTFDALYGAAGRTSVIKLRVPGSSRPTSGLIKSVQRHPVTRTALHVDFFVVNLLQEMELDIPLVLVGEAPAVESTGGTLLHNLSQVRVKALPNDIPHQIDVDVSVLATLDDAIHVRDLQLNRDKVNLLTDPDAVVATVVPPRQEEEPEPAVAAELDEEAAEAAADVEAPTEGEATGRETPGEEGEASAG